MVSTPSRSDDGQGMCERVEHVARGCPINNLCRHVAEDDAKRVLVEVCVLQVTRQQNFGDHETVHTRIARR